MIRGITESLEEQLPTAEDYDTSAVLLRGSIRTMFERLSRPDTMVLHLYHRADKADIRIDLNRMAVVVDAADPDESHFYAIDGRLDPPIRTKERVVRTDALRSTTQPAPPEQPRGSNIRRALTLGLLGSKVTTNPQPSEPTITYDYRDSREVGKHQIERLFTWIAGAQLVEQEIEVVS